MFFTDLNTTIPVWLSVFVLSIFSATYLACRRRAHKPDRFETLKVALAILTWIGIIIFLIFNWCNVALMLLVSHLAFTAIATRVGFLEIPHLCLPLMAVHVVCGTLIVLTQTYTPVVTHVETRPIKSYDIIDDYHYTTNGMLTHDYSLSYVYSSDDFRKAVIRLDNAEYGDVRLCVDAERLPRVEIVTYEQSLIDHCPLGGDINLGSITTMEETVIYLPELPAPMKQITENE